MLLRFQMQIGTIKQTSTGDLPVYIPLDGISRLAVVVSQSALITLESCPRKDAFTMDASIMI